LDLLGTRLAERQRLERRVVGRLPTVFEHPFDRKALRWARRRETIAQFVTSNGALNLRELERYLQRVSDRWQIRTALLGGARVDDLQGAGPQRERGPEYVIVLVSDEFQGIPWLERVYHAGNLWDESEMQAPADVHCYTPEEFERKRTALPRVRRAAERGIDLLAA
jgi:hypothetical protein